MQLTDRFLDFADQHYPVVSLMGFTHLGLYLSAPPDQEGPPLILIKQWSSTNRALPAADVDPELRQASEERRWYPLQDAGLILVPFAPNSRQASTGLRISKKRCADAL